MNTATLSLIVLTSLLATSLAQQKPNNTVRPSASDKVTAKSSRSEFHHGGHGGGFEHHIPHHFGGGGHLGGYGHYKEFDHYLMPLLVVLGLGVLVMPLLSVLMTTMVGNVPVTTLVSGRKKRDLAFGKVTEDKVMDLFKRFGKAYEAFNGQDK